MNYCIDCREHGLAVSNAIEEATCVRTMGEISNRKLIAAREAQRVHGLSCPSWRSRVAEWLLGRSDNSQA
jgi:hypothetical protein